MAEKRHDHPDDPINAQDSDWEEAGLPAQEDTTEDQVLPGEQPVAMGEFGSTGTEREAGEPLDTALAREEPDIWEQRSGPEGGAAADPVAGRLVAEDEGARPDRENELVAEEGLDRGAFSAEEQAVREQQE